jgi:ribonucleotide monophosphatase NagD (HAD superfamily)
MWFQPPAEKACLTSRSLAFDVHPIGARATAPDTVNAFAYRYGEGWRVVYVGRQVQHKIDTAIGYGATHLLVLEGAAADESWLIDELKPPLNETALGGWR